MVLSLGERLVGSLPLSVRLSYAVQYLGLSESPECCTWLREIRTEQMLFAFKSFNILF